MSDVQMQQDWWQASDGKWYPPERHPDYRPQGLPPLPQDPGRSEFFAQLQVDPTVPPRSPEDPTTWAPVHELTEVAAPPPSRQMFQAQWSDMAEAGAPVGARVSVTRRFRLRRLPCGHCSARLPRFMALAPAVITCPSCGNKDQVMEGWFFRRGYPVGEAEG